MSKFTDIYLSDEPVMNTNITFRDGTTSMTPLWSVQNLMVYALQRQFAEIQEEQEIPFRLRPQTVFGMTEQGESKYTAIARYMVMLTETLNDQFGKRVSNEHITMFNNLFKKPVDVNGKKMYLRVKEDALYWRTNRKVRAVFAKANYIIPLPDKYHKEIKKIFEDAYIDLIEGKIERKDNKPVMKNGQHNIIEPSDFQIANQMIFDHKQFYESEFNTSSGDTVGL